MKKLFILTLVLAFGSVPHVFAQGFVPLAPIPGLTQGVTADSASLAQFFNNLYLYLIGFAAMLAVIEIIWGGLLYSTTDSIGNKEEGKEKIRMAIFGLVLVLSPVLVFSIINPSILNLSFNLPPLDLKVTPSSTVTTQLPTCVGTNRVNCTPAAPLNEGTTVSTVPTCGPGVIGTCTTATAPSCPSGKWYFTTTNASNFGAIVDSSSQSECQTLYDLQKSGKGGSGITVTSSGCSLCP